MPDFAISRQDVIDSINTLKVGKATGPDFVNSYVLKEISSEISLPLQGLFNFSLRSGKVPRQWKIANVCAIYKKSDPQDVSNYRPVSLLSVVSKVLERIIHKYIFNHLRSTDFLSIFQSGFIPKDSTVNQLVSIYHSFCLALDEGKEVRAVFCDISKAFDRVWHDGLLFKLRQSGISGPLLVWLTDYLHDRKQCVVLSGAKSNMVNVSAGVPQGSILGPLLFLVYINDIVNEIRCPIRLFADDTALYIIVDDPVIAANQLNDNIGKIYSWADQWLVSFNPSKTKALLFTRRSNRPLHPPLHMNNTIIEEVTTHRHLGVTLSGTCSWHDHIRSVLSKAWVRINIMRSFKFVLDRKSLEIFYISFIRPLLEYGDVVWNNITQSDEEDLEKVQHEAARIISGATRLVSLNNLYTETGLESLKDRRRKHKLILFYKMSHNLVPSYLSTMIPARVGDTTSYPLRNSTNIRNITCKTQLLSSSFLPSVITSWNNLPHETRSASSLPSFKYALNKNKKQVPQFYYGADRRTEVEHARLRMHCSSLKEHLFSKNIVDSPYCDCGEIEDSYHFIFQCPLYQEERQDMLNGLSPYGPVTLQLVLFGSKVVSDDINAQIFREVHTYIQRTRRFRN